MDLGGGGVYRYGDLHCSASLDVAPYIFGGEMLLVCM